MLRGTTLDEEVDGRGSIRTGEDGVKIDNRLNISSEMLVFNLFQTVLAYVADYCRL